MTVGKEAAPDSTKLISVLLAVIAEATVPSTLLNLKSNKWASYIAGNFTW